MNKFLILKSFLVVLCLFVAFIITKVESTEFSTQLISLYVLIDVINGMGFLASTANNNTLQRKNLMLFGLTNTKIIYIILKDYFINHYHIFYTIVIFMGVFLNTNLMMYQKIAICSIVFFQSIYSIILYIIFQDICIKVGKFMYSSNFLLPMLVCINLQNSVPNIWFYNPFCFVASLSQSFITTDIVANSVLITSIGMGFISISLYLNHLLHYKLLKLN